MEFYKLFKRRTNFYELFEWIDRGFRPEKWALIDSKREQAYRRFLDPLQIMHNSICKAIMN